MIINSLLTLLRQQNRFHVGELKQQLKLSIDQWELLLSSLNSLNIAYTVTGSKIVFNHQHQFLEPKIINSNLQLSNKNTISEFVYIPVISSTSDYLKNGKRHTAICIAEMQLNGRGRRGAEWISPFATNIYLSIKLPIIRHENIGIFALGVGVSIKTALNRLKVNNILLKWPNDIYLENKKLGGIIIDLETDKELWWVVIGIGLNVNMEHDSYQNIDQPWSSLKESGFILDRNIIIAYLIDEVMNGVQQFEKYHDEAILRNWNEHDFLKDKTIKIVIDNREEIGLACGIGKGGALLLQQNNRIMPYTSGHIELLQ